jgi:hypothetical protein
MKHGQQKKKKAPPLLEESNKTLQIALCVFLVIATLAVTCKYKVMNISIMTTQNM